MKMMLTTLLWLILTNVFAQVRENYASFRNQVDQSTFFKTLDPDTTMAPVRESYRARLQKQYAGVPPEKIPQHVKDLLKAMDDLDKVTVEPNRARDRMFTWRRQDDGIKNRVVGEFKHMTIAQTGDSTTPWRLEVKGKEIYRFTKRLGEGADSVNYLTDKGTVVKVSLKPNKSLVLGVWGEDLYTNYGIHTAPILNVDSNGLFIEQAFMPGGNLENKFRKSKVIPSQEVIGSAVDQWERAVKMGLDKGIWHDFKPDNFTEVGGKVTTVDLCPLVNEEYIHIGFFNDSQNGFMKQEQFLKRFFGQAVPWSSPPKIDPCRPSGLFAGAVRDLSKIFFGK